ncbi:MAG: 50S ribosome-binding GTPase, partial [Chloroflexi bacterium]|nr:50S ribosome-binding GTPase [Chloroflexota bacterium]
LERIAEIVQPEKVTPTTLRVVDIAGLVKGASRGEGLGNQFLSHIRTVDAIAMVVRCFEDADIPHVTPYLDPIEDIETVNLELILADLALLERHLERVRAQAKAHPREYQEQIEGLEAIAAGLRQGIPLRRQALEAEQRAFIEHLDLLTDKPMIYVANVSEDALPEGGALAHAVVERAHQEGVEAVVLCAALEAEIATWERDEAMAYL